jgi:hypothetical protein
MSFIHINNHMRPMKPMLSADLGSPPHEDTASVATAGAASGPVLDGLVNPAPAIVRPVMCPHEVVTSTCKKCCGVRLRAFIRSHRKKMAEKREGEHQQLLKWLAERTAEEVTTLAYQQRNAVITMVQTRHDELSAARAAAEQAQSKRVRMQAEAAADIARIQDAVARQVLTAAEAEQQLQLAQGQIHAVEQHVKQVLEARNVKLARDLLANEDRQIMDRALLRGVAPFLPLDAENPLGEPFEDHEARYAKKTALSGFREHAKARQVKRKKNMRMLWRYARFCFVGMLVLCAIGIVLKVYWHAILAALGFAGAVPEPPVVASCNGQPGAATKRLFEIKRDYREKAKSFHPDKHTQANKAKAATEFIQLQKTYSTELKQALHDVETEEQCHLTHWAFSDDGAMIESSLTVCLTEDACDFGKPL